MDPETSLKSYKKKRASLKSQLTRFDHYIQNFNDDYEQLKLRLDSCQKMLEEFNEIQMQIELFNVGGEDSVNIDEYVKFEDAYFKSMSKASSMLKANVTTQNVTTSSSVSVGTPPIPGVKFPKIDLITFSGDYEEFMHFYDSFKALIHDNTTLGDIERFHYLRSSLKGEASQVISGLETTASNYQVAWQILQDRYNNKRLIIHNHIKALFELTIVHKESHVALRQLLDNLNKHLRALETLNEPVQHWDTLLIYLVCSKLDNISRREWEIFAETLSAPTTKDFVSFLNKRCNLLQTISSKGSDRHSLPPSSKFNKNINKNQSQTYLCVQLCPICKGSHKISVCDKFLQLTPKERYFEIKKHKLCTNCLGTGHGYQTCIVDKHCNLCNKKHHLLLHFENNSDNVRIFNSEPLNSSEGTSNKSVSAHATFHDGQVLLSTAIVYICDAVGGQHECKVLLDSGSQSNFITKELCDKLNLSKESLNVPISGLGQICTNVAYGVHATIKSQFNNFNSNVSFLVVDHITENLPLNYIEFENVKIPHNIKLADPCCNVPSRIDALLGASIFWNLLCIGQIKLANSQIIAQKTKLGWILSGQVSMFPKNPQKTLCYFSTTRNIQNQLEAFWKIEHCEPKSIWSLEQRACEEHFVATHKREDDGRFLVSLPLRNDISKLGESRQIAANRFYSVERKLQRNLELKTEYGRFLKEYEALGHMSEVNPENQAALNYLPHHGVVKESSATTKLRVVFDASAKTDSGSSLNDILMVGPVLQPELFSIILRFRKHKYVLSADCAKMYRQINVQQDQRHLQTILWRDNPTEPLKSYTLNTVSYGVSSASYLAVRCLFQLAEENESKNPKVSKIIKNDFYMDDLISGGDTIEEVLELRHNITQILLQGKFELRKWRSNNISIICNDYGAQENFEFSENKESKTLGLVWNSQDDVFQYNLQHIKVTQKYVTKRTILSYISKIFDPLGLIGPIIIKAKIILQQLWQLSLDWDESVPTQIYSSWKTYQDQIETLKTISVPRHITCSHPLRIEVHTFCDASETAYGVCIYVRSLNSNGTFFTRLLCAKSRVAPLKSISLPRLELCGALLAARLCSSVVKALDMPVDHLYHWCDSSVVLTWIMDKPCKWKTFVGNRVAEIQELSNKEHWRHIRSGDNPADIISRGINPAHLINSTLWWQGPQWLQNNCSQWPSSLPIKVSDVPERKNVSQSLVATEIDLSLFLRISSFLKLQRVVAYMIRFKNNCIKQSIETGPLKPHELENSLSYLVRLAQNQFFADEIKCLSNKKPISPKSKLFNLNPFIDAKHLLRVGGRLNLSNLNTISNILSFFRNVTL